MMFEGLFLLADGTGFILLSISNINQYQPELLMDHEQQLERLRVCEENRVFVKEICSNNTFIMHD